MNWAKEVMILVKITVSPILNSLPSSPTGRRLGGHLHIRCTQNDFIKSWDKIFCLLHMKANAGKESETDEQTEAL